MEVKVLFRNIQQKVASEVISYNHIKFKIEADAHSFLIYILNENGLHLIGSKNDLSDYIPIKEPIMTIEECVNTYLHNFKSAENYIKMIF